MLKIGDLKLKSNIILAPMSGVSDLPFRLINRKFGCELAFTEMINVHSLCYKNKKSNLMLTTNRYDKPLGIQILGSEEEYILKAIDILKDYEFDVLDFNAACPMRKVVSRGSGASLLRCPEKLNKLLKIMVQNTKKPVTVKIRIGWDEKSINAKEVSLCAQESGIKALFIHGRCRSQCYSGTVDYKTIKIVKDSLKIPVIASGDIFSAKFAKKMFDETGCDGIIVARGALGNPWIFKEIKEYFKNGEVMQSPTLKDIVKIMVKHIKLCVDFYGERTGVVIFRKFIRWYTKGFHNVRDIRVKAMQSKTKAELLETIKEFYNNKIH
jgi:tRNA-dihydrouridine synthase B